MFWQNLLAYIFNYLWTRPLTIYLVSMHCSGQTETVSVWFRPKISACFGFGVSVFSLFGVLAETACFGQNTLYWLILAAHFSKKSFAKTSFFETGRKCVLAKISVSAEISAFPGGLVSVSVFRPKIFFVCSLIHCIVVGNIGARMNGLKVMAGDRPKISITIVIQRSINTANVPIHNLGSAVSPRIGVAL